MYYFVEGKIFWGVNTMNEAVRNLAVLLWAVCAMNGSSHASEGLVIREETRPTVPTVIMGKAITPSGKMREVVVEQPSNAPNPLGNPIVDAIENTPSMPTVSETKAPKETKDVIQQSSPSGELKPDEVVLPQPSSAIENELYQSGDDVVDVQAYPIEDVKKITEPNIEPTVVSY